MVWYKLKEYYNMIILLQLSIFVFLYNFISELHCWDSLFFMFVTIRAATKTFYSITEISFVASIHLIETIVATDEYYTECRIKRDQQEVLLLLF